MRVAGARWSLRRNRADTMWKSKPKQLDGEGQALELRRAKSAWAGLVRRSSWLASLAVMLTALPAAAAELSRSAEPLTDPSGLLSSPPLEASGPVFNWSHATAAPGGNGTFTLDHFTPRMSGLALTLPDPGDGTHRAGLRGGSSAAGAGLDIHRGFLAGQDISVTIGSGFASERAPSLDAADAMTLDTAGAGARVRISRVSLGSAVFGTRATRFSARPGAAETSGGYDLDLSYSFDTGSLSLQHSAGMGGQGSGFGQVHQRDMDALAGRYLLGPSLDMTAWVGHGGTGDSQPLQPDFEGWAMLTGLRLSF